MQKRKANGRGTGACDISSGTYLCILYERSLCFTNIVSRGNFTRNLFQPRLQPLASYLKVQKILRRRLYWKFLYCWITRKHRRKRRMLPSGRDLVGSSGELLVLSVERGRVTGLPPPAGSGRREDPDRRLRPVIELSY
jgi:hypothetical protein